MLYTSLITLAAASALTSLWMIGKDLTHLPPAAQPVSSRPQAEQRQFLTFSLPEQTGDRFSRLSFTELDPAQVGAVQFELERTEAFIGTPEAIERPVAIADTWGDETGTAWIQFDSPLAAGTTLTVAFTVTRRSVSQSPEFGVAAYPETGAAPVFAGNARLTVSP